MPEALIIGCGYTGQRVARSLLDSGISVTATTRDPAKLKDLESDGARVARLDVTDPGTLEELGRIVSRESRVLVSVPTLRMEKTLYDPTLKLAELLEDKPLRVVYLSTTGVYGAARDVDETTPVAPVTQRQRLRVAAEQAVAGSPWASLILRPAAIYGPGRGVHVAMRQGRFKLAGDGTNFVSRIHVDDLAAIAEKALLSDVTGAYPVADEEPSASRDIAAFCARLLNLPMPPSVSKDDVSETRRSDRRVDGSAICRVLGVALRYPSYKVGIPAALAAE